MDSSDEVSTDFSGGWFKDSTDSSSDDVASPCTGSTHNKSRRALRSSLPCLYRAVMNCRASKNMPLLCCGCACVLQFIVAFALLQVWLRKMKPE